MSADLYQQINALKQTGSSLREIWRFLLESPRLQEFKELLGGDTEVHLWSFLLTPELSSLWRDPVLLPEDEVRLPSWKEIVRASPVTEFRLKVLTFCHQSPFAEIDKIPIFFQFLKDEDSTVRLALLQFLNEYSVTIPETLFLLHNQLAQETISSVQLALLHYLEKWDIQESYLFLPILSKLLQESDRQVRHKVVDLLGKWTIEETQSLLEKAIKDDDFYVRLNAEKILQQYRGKTKSFQNSFEKILQIKDWYERSEAVLALSSYSNTLQAKTAFEFLRQLLIQEENPYVRVAAVTALAKYPKSAPLLSALEQVLKDTSHLVRVALVQTWGQLPVCATDVIEFLPSLLRDEEPNVRLVTTKLIGFLQIETSEIREILTQQSMNDPEFKVCQMTLKALSRFSPHETIQIACQKALQNSYGEVRSVALQILATQYWSESDRFSRLESFLKDPSGEVRWTVLHILAEISAEEQRLLEVIQKLLVEETYWNVRATAVEILARFSGFEDLRKQLLLAFLNDPEEYVQWESAVALKKLGEKKTICTTLQKLKKSPIKHLRQDAGQLLQEIERECEYL